MRAPLSFRAIAVAAVVLLGGGSEALPADPGRLPESFLARCAREEGPWGTVYHRGWRGDERGLVAGRITAALESVEIRLGRRRGRPFTAVLTRDRAEFAEAFREVTGRRPDGWIAGVAFPSEDLLLVKGEAFSIPGPRGEGAAEVLEHELAHLVLHRVDGVALPRWLDEGLALWASGRIVDPDDEAFLSGLARIGALAPLGALDGEMSRSHDPAAIAYEQSRLAVQWLHLRFGRKAVGELLDRLEAGDPFEAALARATGAAPETFEEGFRSWLARKRSLLEALAGTVSLWTVASILAVLAILRHLVRRRRLLRKMEEREEEEEGAGPGPSGPSRREDDHGGTEDMEDTEEKG